MTVEEVSGNVGGADGNFPVGMRVLAVDDDPTCLMVLDGLLKKCQYQVTTASRAKAALKMLREHRNGFDLIISDVHMPDMDGFKLLKLVGLEMDLPVIMLSGNSDPNFVMKGIKRGACDYLVKPVRIEELRNIWQHVIRKKKTVTGPQNNSSAPEAESQQGNGTPPNGGSHENDRSSSKRKGGEGEEEWEDNGTDAQDPSTQKKARFVWKADYHMKFVAAVNQLGIGKAAVPKKILKLMNVEGLTRENVASHLQKYRLHLKRISSSETHPRADIVAASAGKYSSMCQNSMDGVDIPVRYSSSALSSYSTGGGLLTRVDSPSSGGNLQSSLYSSPPLIPANHSQSTGNSFSTLGKFDPVVSQPNPNLGLFQVVSKPVVSSASCLPKSGRNTLTCLQNGGLYDNFPSLKASPTSSQPFNTELLDFQSYPSSLPRAFNHDTLLPNGIMVNKSFSRGYIRNNSLDFSSANDSSMPIRKSEREIQCQVGLFGSFKNTHNVVPVNSFISPYNQSFDPSDESFQRKTDLPSVNLQNSNRLPSILQQSGNEKLDTSSKIKPNEDHFLEDFGSKDGFIGDDFEDLINSLTKQDEEGNMFNDGDLDWL